MLEINVHHYFHSASENSDSESKLAMLLTQGEKIMADLAQIYAALEALKATVVDEKAEVALEISGLKETIVNLQNSLNNGNVVTTTDLDLLLEAITGIEAQVEAISEPAVVIPTPVEPTPIPTPEPTPVDPIPVDTTPDEEEVIIVNEETPVVEDEQVATPTEEITTTDPSVTQ